MYEIAQAAAVASDLWGVLQYHEPVFYPKCPEETVLFPVYTTKQRNFALYVTDILHR